MVLPTIRVDYEYDYEHAHEHEHDELKWRANPAEPLSHTARGVRLASQSSTRTGKRSK